MRANRTEYLFSVNTHTPPTMTVDSGEEFTVEVRGAFDHVEDIAAVPTPFTPACDGHPSVPSPPSRLPYCPPLLGRHPRVVICTHRARTVEITANSSPLGETNISWVGPGGEGSTV